MDSRKSANCLQAGIHRAASAVRLSVLMAVHDGAAFLAEALESLCRQTCPADEIVVVDDASLDGTAGILQDYRRKLPLRLLTNPERQGLTRSLLHGWAETRGEFIARMDADDISLPRRFERQLTHMANTPSLGMCGTWARAFSGRHEAMRMPVHPQDVKARILWGNPFIHSSIMLRKARFDAAGLGYDPVYPVAQDYDLWARAMAAGLQGANVPEYLVAYRVHGANVTFRQGQERIRAVGKIIERELKALKLNASEAQIELHRQISECDLADIPERVQMAFRWLRKLAETCPMGNEAACFWSALRLSWYAVCYRNLVEQDSQCPALYFRRNGLDPLGWRRWLLHGACLKKKARLVFQSRFVGGPEPRR